MKIPNIPEAFVRSHAAKAWPLGLAGAGLLTIGSLLSWSYDRTILGNEVLLSSDGGIQDAATRVALLHFALGKPLSESEGRKHDLNTGEAIRRW